MFEYLESISITEGEQIKKTIQALFRQTCILQVKYDPATLVPKDNVQYEICVRHRHFIEDYLSVLGCELTHDAGIRIFRFNKKNIFPKLKPYKMDREAFQEALERGAGIPLEEKKKEKLEKLNAGELEELKKCILEKGVEIEQEILLAENAIAEN